MRTKGKEVKTVKVMSEIIPAEMNGCLHYDGMGEGRDTSKIKKCKYTEHTLEHSKLHHIIWVIGYSYWIVRLSSL